MDEPTTRPTALDVIVRDVTLRDGLQDETPVATEVKQLVVEALVAAGVRDLELTSFVRPDRVPALADAEALVAGTAGHAGEVTRWGLVLNRRGAERAVAAGLGHLQFVLSVSEAHNAENAGRSTAGSIEQLAEIRSALDPDHRLEVTLATAFGCPFTGAVDPGRVAEVAAAVVDVGVDGVGLADTIGTAVPREVAALVGRLTSAHPTVPVGVHLHDTRGLGVANAFAAVDAGVRRLDASLGGLGGCPFAPGASGNVSMEDLVHALEESGLRTGISVDGLVEAARLACDAVGRDVASHVGVAGRRFAELAARR